MVQARDAAEDMVRALSQVLRSFKQRAGQELTVQHAAVGVLYCAAERDKPRPSDVATAMRLDLSTVSRHIQALERDGYLLRTGDPADRRACRLAVTPQGRAVLDQMREQRIADLSQAVAGWTARDRAALCGLLGRLAEGMKEPADTDVGPERPGPRHDHAHETAARAAARGGSS